MVYFDEQKLFYTLKYEYIANPKEKFPEIITLLIFL